MNDNFTLKGIKSVCLANPTAVLSYKNLPTTISCQQWIRFWADELWSRDENEDALSETKYEIYRYAVPVLLLLCALVAAGNLFIVVATACSLRNVKMSNRLLALLSLAAIEDWSAILVGAGLFVNSYRPYVLNRVYPGAVCGTLLLEAFRLGSFVSQSLHLIAIAIFNDSEVMLPGKGSWRRNFTLAMLGTIWVLPTVSFVAVFNAIPRQGFNSIGCFENNAWSALSFRLTLVLAMLLPAILAVLANVRSIKRRPVLESGRGHEHKRDVRTNLFLAGVFVVAWMPAAVVYVTASDSYALDPARSQTKREIVAMLTTGVIVNGLTIIKGIVNALLLICRVNEVNSVTPGMRGMLCVSKYGHRQACAVGSSTSKVQLSLLDADAPT